MLLGQHEWVVVINKVVDGWRRFWGLSWWWKGPTLAVIPLISLTIGLALVIAAAGGNKTAVLEVTLKPTPTSTVAKLSPIPTATSEPPSQVSEPETTTQTELAEQPLAAQQPPSPSTQAPAIQPTEPPPPVAQPSPPPPPPPAPPPAPTPVPTPVPIDLGQVCTDDASTVSSRVESHYFALGYVSTTYEGMGEEAFNVYFDFCMASDDGYVDIFDFCYGVAENAWRYFFYQDDAAGWLPDCLSGAYY